LNLLSDCFSAWFDDGLEAEQFPVRVLARLSTTNFVLSDVEPKEVETRLPVNFI
jgi:hypothetical protein